jgi:predicted protein tyrosine phosphatase
MRVLFVCHFNRKRSATAERVFGKDPALDVRSAGTCEDALVRVNARMLEWADVIFTMDEGQQRDLSRMFPDHAAFAKIVCLGIPDEYEFLDPALVALLRERTAPHFDRLKGG